MIGVRESSPFAMDVGARYTADIFLVPEDPLGELPEAELNLRRFCFYRNRAVIVRVGEKERQLLLFPDVALTFLELRDAPRQLQWNNRVSLIFPESACRLSFRPENGTVECRLEEFGARLDSATCQANLVETTAALNRLVDEVLAGAVDSGYLTAEQAEQLA